MVSEEPVASDAVPEVLAAGDAGVACAVLSLSARHPAGEDARYLEWHMLDHLPEQYRIGGIRSGQRWVSTPACRSARFASEEPFDAVDHVVSYLFAPPVTPALDTFFALGGHLRAAGRMPLALPRVHVGIWNLVDKRANPRVLVGADVLPWRPNRGAFVIIQREPADRPEVLAAVDGVAGLWRFAGTSRRHPRAEDCADLVTTICYLDADPIPTTEKISDILATPTPPAGSILLAAPFARVVPFAWPAALP